MPSYNHLKSQNFPVLLLLYCLVGQLYLTVSEPVGYSMPDLPILHHLPEFAEAHVCWVSDPIQLFLPLLSPSPPALSLFHHKGIFWGTGSLHQVAKVLEHQLQHQSLQWIFRVDFLLDWPVWSPCCPRDPQESFPATQFESISSLVLSLLYGSILKSVHDYWKNHSFDYMELFWQSNASVY